MIDVNNQEHLEAVREACADPIDVHEAAFVVVRTLVERGVPMIPWFKAHHALSSPALAASLVRDLLAPTGSSVDIEHHRGVQWRVVYYVGDQRVWFAVNWANGEIIPDIPRLILALAEFAPGDKEGAMRALREVGR